MRNDAWLLAFSAAQLRMLEAVPIVGSSRLESVPMIDRVRAESRERSGAKHWRALLRTLLCSHCLPRTLSQAKSLDAHCSVMVIWIWHHVPHSAYWSRQVKARLQPDISSRDLGSRFGSFAAMQAETSALQRHAECLSGSGRSRHRSLWKPLASREVILASEMRRHREHPVDPSRTTTFKL